MLYSEYCYESASDFVSKILKHVQARCDHAYSAFSKLWKKGLEFNAGLVYMVKSCSKENLQIN